MSKVYKLYAAAMATLVLFTSGCNIFNVSRSSKTDSFSEHLSESVDPEILAFDRKNESNKGEAEYWFVIRSDHAEGVGEEAKKLYKATNEMLDTDEYRGRKIIVYIVGKGNNVTSSVASFSNFSRDGKKIDTKIISVRANGIDDLTYGYDKYYHYEINDMNYWNTYSDTDVEVTGDEYVQYQTLTFNMEPQLDAVKKHLEEFEDYIEFSGAYTNENGTHICNVDLEFTVLENKVISDDRYASATEVMIAVREKMNEYVLANPDDELMSHRVAFLFTTDTGEDLGYISNFSYRNDKEPMADGFQRVSLLKATAEEYCSIETAYEINLFGRSEEEIRLILDSVSGVKHVTIHYTPVKEAVEGDYSDITFY